MICKRGDAHEMKYFICYDIPEDKIRAKVAKYLESVAIRVQRSVFLCDANEFMADIVKETVDDMTSESEGRRLMVIPVCAACESKIWQRGSKIEENMECCIA